MTESGISQVQQLRTRIARIRRRLDRRVAVIATPARLAGSWQRRARRGPEVWLLGAVGLGLLLASLVRRADHRHERPAGPVASRAVAFLKSLFDLLTPSPRSEEAADE